MVSVAFTAAAQQDVVDAVDWYERQAPGLGARLVTEIGAAVGRIANNPQQYAVVHKDARRALLRRFPYGLFYRLNDGQVEVVACFHTSRDPRRWRGRLQA